jgi:two-component system sensor histidine kinase BarA
LSYHTFKRVLGESNLERKFRRLFGLCMLVMITGSFWWYGRETDQIVYDQNKIVGKALVQSAMMEAHNRLFARQGFEQANDALTDLFRLREFNWSVIYPDAEARGSNPPTDADEHDLRRKWEEFGKGLATDAAIDEASANPDNELTRSVPGERDLYIYYQPVFAYEQCANCHRREDKLTKPYIPNLKTGELVGVFRIEFDTKDTQYAQTRNRSLLLTLGIVTVGLAMAVMYFVVRYIIVKPLTHLRDVSDAVRRGDVEQRAVIHTGDEFEELGAAFNRMLRQLLRQQDELRSVNGELDTKIDELAQLNMRLFESNKVKGDFLATVSHELRTPLNSILGFSDLLSSAKQLDDKQKRYAGNIERSGRQLLDMINDMLDLAKIESGRMEVRPAEFDVGAVVLTQCDLVRPLAEKKHIELDCEIAPDLPLIFQDRGKIEQILNNLLTNAVKFTPDGGRIHVTVHQDRRGDLRLTVADTGVGISESEQVAVFEKFRQGASALAGDDALKREYSGSGLGLSIVRELCRLLGGDVTLESELGRGSEFTVILPWNVGDPTGAIENTVGDELRQLAGAARNGDPAADI